MYSIFMRFLKFFIPTITVCAVAASILPGGAVRTFDETELLHMILEEQMEQQSEVLGESTQKTSNPCGVDKPIIGWIDFAGNKTIQGSLAENMQPSACFFDIEEANQAGFFYREE